MATGVTQRVVRRNSASTGCSGLCPHPIFSHTFSYIPIINRAANRCSPYDSIACAFFSPHTRGDRIDRGFVGSIGKGSFWVYCRQLEQPYVLAAGAASHTLSYPLISSHTLSYILSHSPVALWRGKYAIALLQCFGFTAAAGRNYYCQHYHSAYC